MTFGISRNPYTANRMINGSINKRYLGKTKNIILIPVAAAK